MRGGLAVDGGVDRENGLADISLARLALADAVEQPGDIDIIRPNAVERRQHAAEHMIARGHEPRALQRPKVRDRLDDQQYAGVASRVLTDRAGVDRVYIAADGAGEDALIGDLHRLAQRPQQFLAFFD